MDLHLDECAESIRHTGRCAIGCPLDTPTAQLEGEMPARPHVMIDAEDWAFVREVVRAAMPALDSATRARLLAMKVQPFDVV